MAMPVAAIIISSNSFIITPLNRAVVLFSQSIFGSIHSLTYHHNLLRIPITTLAIQENAQWHLKMPPG